MAASNARGGKEGDRDMSTHVRTDVQQVSEQPQRGMPSPRVVTSAIARQPAVSGSAVCESGNRQADSCSASEGAADASISSVVQQMDTLTISDKQQEVSPPVRHDAHSRSLGQKRRILRDQAAASSQRGPVRCDGHTQAKDGWRCVYDAVTSLPPEKVIRSVAKQCSSEWYQLGIELGFSDNDIQAMTVNIPTPAGKLQAIVEKKAVAHGKEKIVEALLDVCEQSLSLATVSVMEDLGIKYKELLQGLPPKCILEAVLECGSSRWYGIGVKIYNDNKVTALTADKPTYADKLQAIIQRRQREVGERKLAEDLLEACRDIKDPIYYEVLKEVKRLCSTERKRDSEPHPRTNSGSPKIRESSFSSPSFPATPRGISSHSCIFPPEFEYGYPTTPGSRDMELADIKKALWKTQEDVILEDMVADQTVFLLIVAMGGCGKSTVAAAYARWMRRAYRGGVLRFHAQSSASFHQSLKDQLTRLSGRQQIHHGSIRQDFESLLAFLAQTHNVLLVYDGTDNLDIIRNFIPNRQMRVHAIITTRCSDDSLLQSGDVIRLQLLSPETALTTLLRYSGHQDDQALASDELASADRLANDPPVQRLPLALKHVGSHVNETRSFTAYREHLMKRKNTLRVDSCDLSDLLQYCGLVHLCDLLKENRIERWQDLIKTDFSLLSKCIERSINALELQMLKRMRERLLSNAQASITWEMDIEAVFDRSDDAMNLLCTASLMHCTAFPVEELGRAALPDGTGDLERDSRVSSAMSTLTAFSLIQENRENGTCVLHSLIQQAVVEYMMREGTLSSRLVSLCRCLLTILPQSEGDVRRQLNDTRLLTLTPHLYSIADIVLSLEMHTYEECWQLLEIVCWMALRYVHLDEARSLTEKRLAAAQRTFTNEAITGNTRKLVKCYLEVGQAHCTLSKFESAVSYLEQGIHLLRSASAEVTHSMSDLIRIALHTFALMYQKWGKVSKAIEKYEESLELKRSLVDIIPLDLSSTLMNLGCCYKQMGHLDRACSLYKKTLEIDKVHLPSPHPSLSLSMRHLSDCYRLQGRLEETMELAQNALEMATSSLSSTHPEMGGYMNSLADCHCASGQPELSITWYERAVKVFEQHLPSQAHSLAIVIEGIAGAHHAMGHGDKAIQLLRQSLAIARDCLPSDHPSIAEGLVNLSGYLCKGGQYEECVVHLVSALPILREAEPTSCFTANALFWLGCARMKLNQLTASEQHLNECLRLQQAIYTPEHKEVAETEKLLAHVAVLKTQSHSPRNAKETHV